MALNRDKHRKPVIRAFVALHRETYAEASALLVTGFVYLYDARQIIIYIFFNMAKIELFEDQTSRGTYSQIMLDDGKRILVSLTQTELSVRQYVLGMPIKNIFDMVNVYQLMDILYPYGPQSANANESLLSIVTEIALESGSGAEGFRERFWNNVNEYNARIKNLGKK